MHYVGRFLLLIAVAALAACQPATPTSSSPPLSSTSTPDLLLIVYERVNAETGDHDRWEVYADGRVMHREHVQGYVAPETLMVLIEQAEQAGFFEMEDLYLPNEPASGGMIYALSVRTDGGMKTVVATDNASDEPPALKELFRVVEEIVQREA